MSKENLRGWKIIPVHEKNAAEPVETFCSERQAEFTIACLDRDRGYLHAALEEFEAVKPKETNMSKDEKKSTEQLNAPRILANGSRAISAGTKLSRAIMEAGQKLRQSQGSKGSYKRYFRAVNSANLEYNLEMVKMAGDFLKEQN